MATNGTMFTDEVADKVVQKLRSTTQKYSTARPEDYNFARSTFAQQYGLTESDLTFRLNGLAKSWYDEHNVWPSGMDLLTWDKAQFSIQSFASGATRLGPVFDVIGQDGTTTTWFNDPIFGVSSAPQFDFEFQKTGVSTQRGSTAYSEADLPNLLTQLTPSTLGRIPGDSGSGSGRVAAPFDRRQLEEQATNLWRSLMLEEPDQATLNRIVSSYISDANAFWVREGGRLDFNTFVTDRARATDRYRTLYRRKPDFQSEAEYLGGFKAAVGQFGLSGTETLNQITAGASSGAGLAGFSERVGRTREARLNDRGTFSQKLAAKIKGMGVMG